MAFEPTRATEVSGGRNQGMNFGNVAAEPGTGGDEDHGGGSTTDRNIEYWRCGGDHMKREFPNVPRRNKTRKRTEKTSITNASM